MARRCSDDLEGARELLAEDGDDAELRKVADEAPARLEGLEEEIRLAMVERDPNDDKNVLVEIRAGTGGDEAALFAGDLFKMLTRYAEERGFATESLSQSAAEVGGFKEVTFAIKGEGAYSIFKYEGGTHRVQRVPETESQGRIHTSTATVAVLPEAEEVEVEVDPNDLQIDVYRSSGPGGQSVNTTDSAVRITHEPTGIVVSMQDEKSQLQNKDKAMRVLRARLLERELAEQQAKIASERKAQVGSGERSEKVRTYNFPQGRVTDHRIKLTSHNLDGVLGGELGEFTDALAAEEKRRRLEAGRRAGRPAPAEDQRRGQRRRCARGGDRRAARRPGSRARASTPSCCSPRRPGRSGPALVADPGGEVAPARGAALRRDGAAAAAARAGRLHPRPQGLPPHRARGRPAGPDPPPGDRAAGRAGARARAGSGARRRHRVGRHRPRRRRRAARLRGDRDRHLGGGARGGARQRRSASASRTGSASSSLGTVPGGRAASTSSSPTPPTSPSATGPRCARDHRVGAARGAARRSRRPRRLPLTLAADFGRGAGRRAAAVGSRWGRGRRRRWRGCCETPGSTQVETRRDLAGIERVVVGR